MRAQQESEQSQPEIKWAIQARGSRRFPQRLLFAIADFNRPSWRLLYAVVPISLLFAAALAGSFLIYVYQMYCAVTIMMLSDFSSRFINMTVRIDDQVGKVIATYHMDGSFKKEDEVSIPLEDIKAADFQSLTNETMVELHPEKLLDPWVTVLVPADSEPQFRSSLQHHDILLREEGTEQFPNWLRGRIALTVFLLGVVPSIILLTQPIAYSWGIILVLLFHFVLLLRQGR